MAEETKQARKPLINGSNKPTVTTMADKPRRPRTISAEWILKRIQEGKEVRLKNAVIEGDLNLNKLNLPTRRIKQKIMGTQKDVDVKIVKSLIDIFNSTFQGTFLFQDSTFNELVFFERVTFSEFTSFVGANFSKQASFTEANFSKETWFHGANFNTDAFFDEVTFRGNTTFDNAIFGGYIEFYGATFSGEMLTFRNAEFCEPHSQERACRRAKNVLEKNGNREEAGYHFYQEMDAKRKQKRWYIRYPEYVFIQLIFGYGVHPFRLMACWLGFVGLFAVTYMLWHGIDPVASQLKGYATVADYVWFSIATAVTPGYAGYKPTPDFKLVAGLEAIIGTFMWAAFIATFSRKYMR